MKRTVAVTIKVDKQNDRYCSPDCPFLCSYIDCTLFSMRSLDFDDLDTVNWGETCGPIRCDECVNRELHLKEANE